MSEAAVITRDGLDALIAALATVGYRVCGPTVRDQAIVYDDIEGIDDLPEGVQGGIAPMTTPCQGST